MIPLPKVLIHRFSKNVHLIGSLKESRLRPAKIFSALTDASTLKPEAVEGLDILVVRELTGGIYFGEPRGVETLPDGTRRGVNTLVYTEGEIERIARVAFDVARKRNKRRGLDPPTAHLVQTFVRRELVERQGKTVLFATHSLHEAARIADRVAVLHAGRLAALGSLSDLAQAAGQPGSDVETLYALLAKDGHVEGGSPLMDDPASRLAEEAE